jgi:hypothetical protein
MVTARDVANDFLRQFAQEQEGPAGVDEVGIPKVATIRMDAATLAHIDAMAETIGVSRNVMANRLLKVGLGSVLSELPDVIRDEVEALLVLKLGEA